MINNYFVLIHLSTLVCLYRTMDVKKQYGLQDRHVHQLQSAILGAVKRYDDTSQGIIHPACLQKALDSLGLQFGDEIVDR